MQGADPEISEALGRGDLENAEVTPDERVLLEFAGRLTLDPASNRAEHVNGLRKHGWNDRQIAEGVYITALFAFFNRVADAFGLQDPGYSAMAENGNAVRPAERGSVPDESE